jgi:hypothetical protein
MLGFTVVWWRTWFVLRRFRVRISGVKLAVQIFRFLFIALSINMATNILSTSLLPHKSVHHSAAHVVVCAVE